MERSDAPDAGEATIVLPAEPASAARAREFVRRRVSSSGHGELEDAAALCVTELVANVALHAQSPECVLTVVDEPEDILIEVADHDGEPPTLEPARRMAEHGRGMRIIDALADEWGVRQDNGDGKCVWLRLFSRS